MFIDDIRAEIARADSINSEIIVPKEFRNVLEFDFPGTIKFLDLDTSVKIEPETAEYKVKNIGVIRNKIDIQRQELSRIDFEILAVSKGNATGIDTYNFKQITEFAKRLALEGISGGNKKAKAKQKLEIINEIFALRDSLKQ